MNHDIRLARSPGFRKTDRLRQVARNAFLHTIGNPTRNSLDLLIAQAALSFKDAVSVDRFPRRHQPRFHRLLDFERVPSGVRIGNQRKGCDAGGPMTCLAMLLKNSNDLIVEGDGTLSAELQNEQ